MRILLGTNAEGEGSGASQGAASTQDASLEKCVRGKLQQFNSLDDFPYEAALHSWHAQASARGCYLGQRS